jgi:hypothetical protein
MDDCLLIVTLNTQLLSKGVATCFSQHIFPVCSHLWLFLLTASPSLHAPNTPSSLNISFHGAFLSYPASILPGSDKSEVFFVFSANYCFVCNASCCFLFSSKTAVITLCTLFLFYFSDLLFRFVHLVISLSTSF